MKSTPFRLTILAAGFALAAAPAFAQGRPSPSPGSGGGGGGGQAVDRGSGSSTSSSSPSSGSSGSAGSSGSSASSGSAASAPWPGSSGSVAREAAPQHRVGSAASSGGDHAVPRGSSANNASPANPTRSRANDNTGSNQQDVPSWSRPRGDRPGTDTAVARGTARPPNNGNGGYYPPYYGGYYPYYPYYPYYAPYGNYGFYGPYWGYAAACGGYWGYGFGFGAPLCGLYADPWYAGAMGYGGGYYGESSSGQASYSTGDQGKLRLKIKPKDAKVYVDGYFTGSVDDMDGAFQKLPLAPGRHHVEVKADGYQPEAFEVVIPPNETVTYQGTLKKLQQ